MPMNLLEVDPLLQLKESKSLKIHYMQNFVWESSNKQALEGTGATANNWPTCISKKRVFTDKTLVLPTTMGHPFWVT